MPDPATICNLALSRCGVTRYIDSLDDETTEAEVCKTHYDRVRRLALRHIAPEFAIERASLVEATATPPEEWEYAYKYPDDCLRPLNIVNEQKIETYEDKIPYRVEIDKTTKEKVIFTDQEDALLRYVFDQTDASLWTEEFNQAVAAVLAAHIAMPMTQNMQIVERLEASARLVIYGASAASASEIETGELPDAGHHRARI